VAFRVKREKKKKKRKERGVWPETNSPHRDAKAMRKKKKEKTRKEEKRKKKEGKNPEGFCLSLPTCFEREQRR